MCGIVGILAKSERLRASLGEWLLPMFDCMAERGPDSAGLAVFGAPLPGNRRRFNLFAPGTEYDWPALGQAYEARTGERCTIEPMVNHAVFKGGLEPESFRDWLKGFDPVLHVLSVGKSIDVYKDMGDPARIARAYGFSRLQGTHGIGHTRMATESAVSPAHAHPYTAGEDFALVHNGSLSNPYMLRRKLEAQGLRFESDNDTEAACRFIEWRLRLGDGVEQALRTAFRELDGFYTLLIATAQRLILVRDAFACKPAVVAETPEYVAVASEFRSLAHLPGVDAARIFEPQPEEVYAWTV